VICDDFAFVFSRATFFIMVSFPAEAAAAVFCSIERPIFALNPLRRAAILRAAGFLGGMYRWPFLVDELPEGREAFCFLAWMPLIFPCTMSCESKL